MRFVDRARVRIWAGDGAPGAVAWRREAHVVLGGPAGGDGGRGGDVWLVADAALATLLDFKYRREHRAEPGVPGQSKSRHGRAGRDLELRVPVGTQAIFDGWDEPADEPAAEPGPDDERDPDGGLPAPRAERSPPGAEPGPGAELGLEPAAPARPQPRRAHVVRARAPRPLEPGAILADLDRPGARILLAHGGRGGRGNAHFKSSTRRAPDRAEPGQGGERMWIRLELRLLADVGIVGFPNVGKSTLIRAISRAQPEVADYPFTTLVPMLGVVELSADRRFVVADVPGLVRGASEGRGLGLRFLQHLERTRVLLHVLAPDPDERRAPLADLDALEAELAAYGPMFEGRPRVVALNKIDTDVGRAWIDELRIQLARRSIPLFPISGATGEGLEALLEALWRRLTWTPGG